MQSHNSSTLTRMILAIIFLLLTYAAHGENSSHEDLQEGLAAKPMVFKNIMQQMSSDMVKMTDAISREDWKTVVEFAGRVADHEQPPPSEKMRILRFIGDEASKFRSYDKKVHDAALDIQQAAQQRDGYRVIESFSRTQKNCLACHQAFRDRFKTYFYNH